MSTYKAVVLSLIISWLSPGVAGAEPAQQPYDLGSPASEAEIAGWDIDVPPSGAGLPEGSGTAAQGESIYNTQCAACHGPKGQNGAYPRLAGGQGTLASDKPVKTVGSYWPYATTLYDYIHRAMPLTSPQSLSADETYAVTAYILYINEVIDRDKTLDAATLAEVDMPNRNGFTSPDPRPDVNNQSCMHNCIKASESESQETGSNEDGVPTM